MKRPTRNAWISAVTIGLVAGLASTAMAAAPKLVLEGKGRTVAAATMEVQAVDTVDYVNARPIELPVATAFSEAQLIDDMVEGLMYQARANQGEPVFVPGARGDGKTNERFLGKPRHFDDDSASPAAHGSVNLPFTTARADGASGSTNKIYPWRAAGRLFATLLPSGEGTCSASLIKRGVVVTAAHCVAKFGVGLYSNIRFVPGYRNGQAPYGTWQAAQVRLLASYINGTDSCAQSGVICRNDVAVITVAAQAGKYPGTSAGWYGFGADGFGFTNSGLTHVTQLGYPSCLDNGVLMERNDAQGAVTASQSGNTVIGSLMCGGSSGGPWLINFGHPSKLTGQTAPSQNAANAVIGTTSWVTNGAAKQMGASPFTSQNIVALVNAACAATPAACS